MRIKSFLSVLACVLVLLGFLASVHLPIIVARAGTNVIDSFFPVIQDFYINSTWAGQSSQFSFSVADDVALDHAIFGCNVTQNFMNDSSTPLSGPEAWANFTHTLPSYNCIVSFQFWVWNNNSQVNTTGLRYMKVYTYNSTAGAWNTPFVSLSQAIQAVDAANNWTNADPYAQTILAKYTTTQLQNMIDNYSNNHDWIDTLKWAAICNKLWYNNIPSDVQTDIKYALGNYTMVGSLPYTALDGWSKNSFSPEYQWALYGYYFNNCSWISSYQNYTKWNVTAAYSQFDSAVNYSTSHPQGGLGMPLWIYFEGTAWSVGNRYYDEDANTIQCYIIFDEILNVSDAMNKALYWWNYLVDTHWNSSPGYFQYTPTQPEYECEAGFFLKIISILKYYYPTLGNWTYVLTDLGNRFLGQEWNSAQWLDSNTDLSTYVVVHAYAHLGYGNGERRLQNTLGAWQALLGTYMQMNSTYQNNMKDMLSGNQNTQPAWQLLLTPTPYAELFNVTSDLFKESSSTIGPGDQNSTAMAEILLFMLGIVPGTTTMAFPLEELNYEYIQDIGPQMFQFNLMNQTITIPVNGAGNMTFQYGVSPVTYNFDQSGVWQVQFSSSWNLITRAGLLGSGGPVVPELLSFLILPLFIIATLLAVIVCKRGSRPKYLETQKTRGKLAACI